MSCNSATKRTEKKDYSSGYCYWFSQYSLFICAFWL